MTDQQWDNLLRVIKGEVLTPLPVGFIIDSPWLPGWYGATIMDYYSNDQIWFEANKKAVERFPGIMFLPGFWSEFGMCSEPSAFGARCSFPRDEFPHAYQVIHSAADIDRLAPPNPETDGLAPFLLNRLRLNQSRIEDLGHKIRFSVTRGPLNIASYLMGTSEFLISMMIDPDATHKLLTLITDYLVGWHQLQRETFPSIDGILVLDDIIGFIGDNEFKNFVVPYLTRLYEPDLSVKFLHNDAQSGISLKYLSQIGINMLNMGYDVKLNDLKQATDNKVVMLGNIPPRDVLANGTSEAVYQAARDLKNELNDCSKVIFSCGGGMPPNVSNENINSFYAGING